VVNKNLKQRQTLRERKGRFTNRKKYFKAGKYYSEFTI